MEGTPLLSRLGEEGAPDRRNSLCKGSEALNVLASMEWKIRVYSMGKERDHKRAWADSLFHRLPWAPVPMMRVGKGCRGAAL